MTRAESPEDRAIRITRELREASAEAAGLTKDLRAVMKAAREQVDEYLHTEVQKVIDHYMSTWQTGCDAFQRAFDEETARRLVGWTAVVQNEVSRDRILKEAVDLIMSRIDAIETAHRTHPDGDDGGYILAIGPAT